jgi:hypothetical protein
VLIIGLIIAVLVILTGLIIAGVMLAGAWGATQAFPEQPTPPAPDRSPTPGP